MDAVLFTEAKGKRQAHRQFPGDLQQSIKAARTARISVHLSPALLTNHAEPPRRGLDLAADRRGDECAGIEDSARIGVAGPF